MRIEIEMAEEHGQWYGNEYCPHGGESPIDGCYFCGRPGSARPARSHQDQTGRIVNRLFELSLSGYLKQSERRSIEARLKAFGHDKELALDEAYAGFKVKK